jgi:hypothetical protein
VQRLASTVLPALVLLGSPLNAQTLEDVPPPGGWYVIPTLQVGGASEDNLFFTSTDEIEARFLRLSPTIRSGYRGPRQWLDASYGFDSERYTKLTALNDTFARQRGNLANKSRLGERLSLTVDASYLSTRRPEEIFEDTGLVGPRFQARDLEARAALSRNSTPRLTVAAEYTYSHQFLGGEAEIQPEARSALHTPAARVSYRVSDRTEATVSYALRYLRGEETLGDRRAEDEYVAHVLTPGLTHRLARRLVLSVAVGPRLSEYPAPEGEGKLRELAPEALITLRRQGARMSFVWSYTRTQFKGFGALGFIDTESLELKLTLRPRSRLRIQGQAGVYRNSLAASSAISYRVVGLARLWLGREVSLDGVYRFQTQDRPLLAPPPAAGESQRRTRNAFAVGLTFGRTIRLD